MVPGLIGDMSRALYHRAGLMLLVTAETAASYPFRARMAQDLTRIGESAMTPIEKKNTALRQAMLKFMFYEQQHAAKGTPEADEKARVNRQMADLCKEALAA